MVYINPAGFPTPGLGNHGWRVFIALMVMVIAAGFFVMIRIASRVSAGQLGSDDYAIIVALGFFVVQTTLWSLSVRAGYGADYLALAHWQQVLFNEWWFLGSIFWLCTLAMYKVSVLLLLNRIFVQRPFKIACWSIMVVCGCWAVGNIFGWIFQCIPVPIMWGGLPEGASYKCFNQNDLWISIVAWDVSIDLAILLLPQPMVWKLSLKTREKFMLTGMFLLGAIVVVFSLLSCSAIVSHLDEVETQKAKYSFALANLFQVLESGMGIIGACLPLMRQPIKKIWPKLVGSSGRKTPYYDDEISDGYVMQNISNSQAETQSKAWSASDPFRSRPRKSDELGIISEDAETRYGDSRNEKSRHMVPKSDGIRKDVGYSVDRR